MDVIEIEQQIKSLTNCIECCKTDGCYNCRLEKPNLSNIKEILVRILEKEYL